LRETVIPFAIGTIEDGSDVVPEFGFSPVIASRGLRRAGIPLSCGVEKCLGGGAVVAGVVPGRE